MAILATANINGLGLPATKSGSGCSVSKSSESNQDPKRTDGRSTNASDDSKPISPFEESLYSTIKDHNNQEKTSQQRPPANAKRKNGESSPAVSAQRQKAGPASALTAATESTAPKMASGNSSQPQSAPQPASGTESSSGTQPIINAAIPFAPAPILPPGTDKSGSMIDTLPVSGSDAVNGASAPAAASLDAQIEAPPQEQDSLVFDGTLTAAAPAQTQIKTALPGAGKSTWLLNAQPVYASAAGVTNIKAPDQPQISNSANTNPIPAQEAALRQQPGAAPAAHADVQTGATAASPDGATDTSSGDGKESDDNSGQKPTMDSHVASLTAAPRSPQSSARESSDRGASVTDNAANHGPASAKESAEAHPASNQPNTFSVSEPAGVNAVNMRSANDAGQVSSKSAILPMDQQAEIRQPSMKADLNMRIQGQSGETINLRISERAGDLQISVRASDQTTANVLKHELPSIQAGLERAGWHMGNGGMSQSGQEQREAGRDPQSSDKDRNQNGQPSNWQERNQRRRDSSQTPWFEMEQ